MGGGSSKDYVYLSERKYEKIYEIDQMTKENVKEKFTFYNDDDNWNFTLMILIRSPIEYFKGDPYYTIEDESIDNNQLDPVCLELKKKIDSGKSTTVKEINDCNAKSQVKWIEKMRSDTKFRDIDYIKKAIEVWPEGVTLMDDTFATPLLYATIHYHPNDLEIVKLLFEAYKTVKPDSNGGLDVDGINHELPLHFSIIQNKNEVSEYLIDQYENAIWHSSRFGTPLFYITPKTDIKLIKKMIEIEKKKKKILASIRNSYGEYPLHVACFKNLSLEVIKLIYNDFPDAIKNNDNWNFAYPLHYLLERSVQRKVSDYKNDQKLRDLYSTEFNINRDNLPFSTDHIEFDPSILSYQHANDKRDNGVYPFYIFMSNFYDTHIHNKLLGKNAKERLRHMSSILPDFSTVKFIMEKFPDAIKINHNIPYPHKIDLITFEGFAQGGAGRISPEYDLFNLGNKEILLSNKLPIHTVISLKYTVEIIELIFNKYNEITKESFGGLDKYDNFGNRAIDLLDFKTGLKIIDDFIPKNKIKIQKDIENFISKYKDNINKLKITKKVDINLKHILDNGTYQLIWEWDNINITKKDGFLKYKNVLIEEVTINNNDLTIRRYEKEVNYYTKYIWNGLSFKNNTGDEITIEKKEDSFIIKKNNRNRGILNKIDFNDKLPDETIYIYKIFFTRKKKATLFRDGNSYIRNSSTAKYRSIWRNVDRSFQSNGILFKVIKNKILIGTKNVDFLKFTWDSKSKIYKGEKEGTYIKISLKNKICMTKLIPSDKLFGTINFWCYFPNEDKNYLPTFSNDNDNNPYLFKSKTITNFTSNKLYTSSGSLSLLINDGIKKSNLSGARLQTQFEYKMDISAPKLARFPVTKQEKEGRHIYFPYEYEFSKMPSLQIKQKDKGWIISDNNGTPFLNLDEINNIKIDDGIYSLNEEDESVSIITVNGSNIEQRWLFNNTHANFKYNFENSTFGDDNFYKFLKKIDSNTYLANWNSKYKSFMLTHIKEVSYVVKIEKIPDGIYVISNNVERDYSDFTAELVYYSVADKCIEKKSIKYISKSNELKNEEVIEKYEYDSTKSRYKSTNGIILYVIRSIKHKGKYAFQQLNTWARYNLEEPYLLYVDNEKLKNFKNKYKLIKKQTEINLEAQKQYDILRIRFENEKIDREDAEFREVQKLREKSQETRRKAEKIFIEIKKQEREEKEEKQRKEREKLEKEEEIKRQNEFIQFKELTLPAGSYKININGDEIFLLAQVYEDLNLYNPYLYLARYDGYIKIDSKEYSLIELNVKKIEKNSLTYFINNELDYEITINKQDLTYNDNKSNTGSLKLINNKENKLENGEYTIEKSDLNTEFKFRIHDNYLILNETELMYFIDDIYFSFQNLKIIKFSKNEDKIVIQSNLDFLNTIPVDSKTNLKIAILNYKNYVLTNNIEETNSNIKELLNENFNITVENANKYLLENNYQYTDLAKGKLGINNNITSDTLFSVLEDIVENDVAKKDYSYYFDEDNKQIFYDLILSKKYNYFEKKPNDIVVENLDNYNEYDLDDLPDKIKTNLQILGWDEGNWDGNDDVPDSEYKLWNQLNSNEQSAATNLGYDQEKWDYEDSQELNINNLPEQTINLNKGWNLVGFTSNSINLKELLEINKNIIEIKNENESFNRNVNDIYNTLKEIDVNSGYWLYSSKESLLKIK